MGTDEKYFRGALLTPEEEEEWLTLSETDDGGIVPVLMITSRDKVELDLGDRRRVVTELDEGELVVKVYNGDILPCKRVVLNGNGDRPR